jgi:hypothetical protein
MAGIDTISEKENRSTFCIRRPIMKLSLPGSAFAAGLLWAGALLCTGLANLVWPAYGGEFLQVMSSVYPFFHASGSLGDVLVGTVEGLADGAIAGLLFAWLYNFVGRQ